MELHRRKVLTMRRETVSVLYVINIVLQAFFNILWQIGIMLLLSYLSIRFLGWPEWVYAPFTVFGALTGIYSMVKFILSASRGLENLERQRKMNEKSKTSSHSERTPGENNEQ